MMRAALLALAALAAPAFAWAASEVRLDRAPLRESDLASLQRGAQVFVNYCLGCHGAAYMRYNRLEELGLTTHQIRDNLILTGAKPGDLMRSAMDPRDAREWFGTPAPDLTVIARARGSAAGSGADWLYTYLRSFYSDPDRSTGWNNTVFPDVAMPHVLWELQGVQVLRVEEQPLPGGGKRRVERLVLEKPGKLAPVEYDRLVADLVNFLVYMGEPARRQRLELGIYVLIGLALFWGLAYALKREYWKDVH